MSSPCHLDTQIKLMKHAARNLATVKLTTTDSKTDDDRIKFQSVESGVIGKDLVVRVSGQMVADLPYLDNFVRNDNSIDWINPQFVKNWNTVWSDDDDSALIRHACLSGLLLNLTWDCYGLAAHSSSEASESTWYICAINDKELSKYGKLFDGARHAKAKISKLLEMSIPLIEMKLKEIGPHLIEFRFTIVCHMKNMPMILYKNLITHSACDAMTCLAKNYKPDW